MAEEKVKKKRGCFFYGCLTSIVLFVLMLLMVFMVYRLFTNSIKEYTDTQPRQLPSVQLPEAQMTELRQRVDQFNKAHNAGESAEITLNAEEINALIASDPSFKDFKGHIYLGIKDDLVQAEASVPLAWLPLPGVRDRFFNGSVDTKVEANNGDLKFDIQQLEFKGKKLQDPKINDALEQQVETFKKDPQFGPGIRRLEKVEVKDGKVTIRTRPGGQTKSPAPTPEKPVELEKK